MPVATKEHMIDPKQAISMDSVHLSKIGEPDVDHVNIVSPGNICAALSLCSPYARRAGVDVHPIFGGFGTIEGLIMFLMVNRKRSNFYRQPMRDHASLTVSPEMRALALTLIHRRMLADKKHIPRICNIASKGVYMYEEGRFGVRSKYPGLIDMPTVVSLYIDALKKDLVTSANSGVYVWSNVIKCIEAVSHGATTLEQVESTTGTGELTDLYRMLGYKATVDKETFKVVEVI